MKQRVLVKRPENIGFEFERHGGNHDIYIEEGLLLRRFQGIKKSMSYLQKPF